MIAKRHLNMLAASGITPEHARSRGYETITDTKRLAKLKVVRPGRLTPGLLVPQLRADGSTWGYQYRPDNPRLRDGKPVKYETPWRQRNGIDIPPDVGTRLGDPNEPLWITEGVKKADCAALQGLCTVALPGVWSWRGRNASGGKTAVADFNDIALNDRQVILAFDGDVSRKPEVRQALCALADYLTSKGARVEYLHLPDTDDKTGLDDYLVDHIVADLWRLVKPEPPAADEGDDEMLRDEARCTPNYSEVAPVSLDELHERFLYWFGDHYDLDAIDVALAAAAVERLDGDPLWLLIVSGPGAAKTETIITLRNCVGAVIVSTVTSTGALLSGTSKQQRTKDATGGLLKRLEPHGIMVLKDMTSILSLNTNVRGEILAALREIYDGYWSRNIGTDGGRTLTWQGRIAVVAAVTTVWDQAHGVVSAMGDRFVLLRIDSTTNRLSSGRRAIDNTGHEEQMRDELARLAAGVIAGIDTNATPELTTEEEERILQAADLVTLARTAVIHDYRNDVIDAHAPEAPTRFARQVTQLFRGAVAIGLDSDHALRLAIRAARDSMPPLRLAIIDDLATNPRTTTNDVRKRLDKPWTTVDRQLKALHMLGVLTLEEVAEDVSENKTRTHWYYSLAAGIDPTVLMPPETLPRNMSRYTYTHREGTEHEHEQGQSTLTHISGETNGQPPSPAESARIRQNIIDGYDQ
jgi:hypothetical protein